MNVKMKFWQLVFLKKEKERDAVGIINKKFYKIKYLLKHDNRGFVINGQLNIQGDLKNTKFRFRNLENIDSYINPRKKKMMIVREILSMEISTFQMNLFLLKKSKYLW